jgi:hypothetical protein
MMLASPVKEIDQEALDNIQGWLSESAKTFTQFIFQLQRQNGWVSGILELGVFKGKYLSLLAHQVADFDVPIVGVDAFLERYGVRLSDEHKLAAEKGILDSILSVAGSIANVTLIGAYTNEIGARELRKLCPAGFTFISVDAGHDAEDAEHDSAMADQLLNDHGVIAFDDVYNAACPGVAEGFIRYMVTGNRRLAPFATSGNKVFACRPAQHATYFDFSKDIARNIRTLAPDLSRTLDQLNANEQNGWTPNLCGYEIIPFL